MKKTFEQVVSKLKDQGVQESELYFEARLTGTTFTHHYTLKNAKEDFLKDVKEQLDYAKEKSLNCRVYKKGILYNGNLIECTIK